MTPLLIIIAILVSYLVAGFTTARVLSRSIADHCTIRRGTSYDKSRDSYSSDFTFARDDVFREREYSKNMIATTFAWPVWVPIMLAHWQVRSQLTRYDSNEESNLTRRLEKIRLAQIAATPRGAISYVVDPEDD